MNILIFSWRGPGHPDAGGAEISTHEHAKGWVKAGHNVTLFTSYFQEAKEEEVVDGVLVLRKGNQLISVQWEAFKWYLFGKHIKFDLVIDQFHGIPFFTPFYIRVRKLAFIHEVAKEVWKLNQFHFPFNFIIYMFGIIFEPLIFRLYRNMPFLTVSESTRKDLIQWEIPNRNITVINNGINKIAFPLLPKEKQNTIIYLGALAKDKGIEDALQVFSNLNISASFQFWVVGKADPVYFEKLKLLARNLRLEGQIKFWGFVNERKKYELLSRAHLLIHPSIREGWGLVVIEAASVGTPSVGYNVAGLRDSIIDSKTGILTGENNPEAMTEDVLSLLMDKPRYIQMCQDAKKWSEQFSWTSSVDKSLSLLKQVYEKA